MKRYFKGTLYLLTAVLFMLPFFWMLTAALYPAGRPLPQQAWLWPPDATLGNFAAVHAVLPLTPFLWNSLFVVLIAVPLTVLTSSWAGFAISQLSQEKQRRWLLFSLALLLIPGAAVLFARFPLYKLLGVLDTPWALILPAWMGTSPFYTLMFYRACRRMPPAYFDHLRLEGGSALQAWALVALPAARATAAGVALLAFILYWGDFITPLLYLSNDRQFTLPVALQMLQQFNRTDWRLLMAGSLLVTAVPVLLFIFLQPLFYREETV